LGHFSGSGIGWEKATLPGSTAFAVELPAGPLAAVDRYARAVLAVAR
jgi:hypothetical protein